MRHDGSVERGLRRAGLRATAVALVALIPLLTGPTSSAFAKDLPGTRIGPWTLTSTRVLPASSADEGVATLVRAGRTSTITRGVGSIPADLLAQGWIHIGDPDSRDGYVIDAYQGSSDARSKLFVITAPDGTQSYYRHELDPGETYHNSFAAFTPDRTRFVAGEWGTIHDLEVFTTPTRTASSPTQPAALGPATSIRLTRPMTDVQGCVFVDATTLLCTSSDATGSDASVPDPLIEVHLNHAIGSSGTTGAGITATPRVVGAVAQDRTCLGVGETEGLDVQGSTLTIAVNSPCRPATLLSAYRLSQ